MPEPGKSEQDSGNGSWEFRIIQQTLLWYLTPKQRIVHISQTRNQNRLWFGYKDQEACFSLHLRGPWGKWPPLMFLPERMEKSGEIVVLLIPEAVPKFRVRDSHEYIHNKEGSVIYMCVGNKFEEFRFFFSILKENKVKLP